ncbi:MAG: hypothetical protein H6638_14310 [Ardenticatenales bacterium]|nr:hypothetical protein [Ardenticatenales bacterium]
MRHRDRATVVPPTSSSSWSGRCANNQVGGKAPLGRRLYQTLEVIERELRPQPRDRTLTVLLPHSRQGQAMSASALSRRSRSDATERLFSEAPLRCHRRQYRAQAFDLRGLQPMHGRCDGRRTISLKEFSAHALRSVVEQRRR